MTNQIQINFTFSVFEEPEDPTNRSFFSEIISSISDVKFSNSGRYMISRDYLSVKVWDLHMETKPIETYTVWYLDYLFQISFSKFSNRCTMARFFQICFTLIWFIVRFWLSPITILVNCNFCPRFILERLLTAGNKIINVHLKSLFKIILCFSKNFIFNSLSIQ